MAVHESGDWERRVIGPLLGSGEGVLKQKAVVLINLFIFIPRHQLFHHLGVCVCVCVCVHVLPLVQWDVDTCSGGADPASGISTWCYIWSFSTGPASPSCDYRTIKKIHKETPPPHHLPSHDFSFASWKSFFPALFWCRFVPSTFTLIHLNDISWINTITLQSLHLWGQRVRREPNHHHFHGYYW